MSTAVFDRSLNLHKAHRAVVFRSYPDEEIIGEPCITLRKLSEREDLPGPIGPGLHDLIFHSFCDREQVGFCLIFAHKTCSRFSDSLLGRSIAN
jgi:hypothetical protein